jgi:NTP pyrophosphatase (non-canonical NTP hydrolase)
MFDELAEQLHAIAKEKGFWDQDVDDIFVAKQLMMITSEVVEVLEAVRKDKGEDEIAKEFADIIIRTLDLYAGMVDAGYTKVSLDYAIAEKVKINLDRPQKHGVRF